MDDRLFVEARGRVLADLRARGADTRAAVSALEEALSRRGWWVDQWPEGAAYVVGLVAQDVQDALVDAGADTARWPECPSCAGPVHALHVSPDLGGPDPVWVCEETGEVLAGLGALSRIRPGGARG